MDPEIAVMNDYNKILIITPNDLIGGAENILRMSALELSKKNRVSVFNLCSRSGFNWSSLSKNIKVIVGKGTNERAGLIDLLFFLIKNRNENYIVFTSHTFITAFVGFFRSLGIIKVQAHIGRESTSVFSRFSGMKLRFYRALYYFGYRKINVIICQTPFMMNSLTSGAPYLKKRGEVIVLNNPIDLHDALINSNKPPEIEFFNENSFKIVTAGRLIKEKGFDLLIRSFSDFISSGSSNAGNSELYILGEGTERRALELLISNLKLENRVFLKGNVNNVFPIFKKADICIVSSRIEGFPNVLLQMMAVNKNVISTLCAGGIDQIPGLNTCKANDVHALSEALLTYKESGQFLANLEKRDVKIFVENIKKYTINL